MKVAFSRLMKEEAGAIVSAEIVLVMTILVIGMVVGLKSVRDSVVSELADVAAAIGNIDQSYSYSSITGHAAASGGAFFVDKQDFCETTNGSGPQESKCVSVAQAATSESVN